jgi:uncharacterized protein YjiS (DUF1127 family)
MTPRSPTAPGALLGVTWFALRRLRHGCRQAAELGLVWTDRARQRRQLAELSDHMLRDIGLTRADAWNEADKPFWLP